MSELEFFCIFLKIHNSSLTSDLQKHVSDTTAQKVSKSVMTWNIPARKIVILLQYIFFQSKKSQQDCINNRNGTTVSLRFN